MSFFPHNFYFFPIQFNYPRLNSKSVELLLTIHSMKTYGMRGRKTVTTGTKTYLENYTNNVVSIDSNFRLITE